ncbi:MAG: hypothetical protein M0R51_12190 [Clostridia bacterium]|jgi:hypothetical protein|nr:hypothetical protein [Clostridia bacterium]
MTPEEAKQIADEINANEDLTEEELADIMEGEDEEEEEFDEEEEENSPDQVIETISTIGQPVTTEVEVGADTGAKGEVKPYAKVRITRHMECEGDSLEVYDMIGQDFMDLSGQVKTVIADMKKNLNKNKPEMQ